MKNVESATQNRNLETANATSEKLKSEKTCDNVLQMDEESKDELDEELAPIAEEYDEMMKAIVNIEHQHSAKLQKEKQKHLKEKKEILESALITQLAISLNVQDSEIVGNRLAQQTLVAMAGIFTIQDNSYFNRDTKEHANFVLRFSSNKEFSSFQRYCDEAFAGLIVANDHYDNNSIKVTLDADKLARSVIPKMGQFREKMYKGLSEACRYLLTKGVYESIYATTKEFNENNILGAKLTRKLGIDAYQGDSTIEEMTNYSTKISLIFDRLTEYELFKARCEKQYLGFIVSSCERERDYAVEAEIIVSTQKLLDVVVPLLVDVVPISRSITSESIRKSWTDSISYLSSAIFGQKHQ